MPGGPTGRRRAAFPLEPRPASSFHRLESVWFCASPRLRIPPGMTGPAHDAPGSHASVRNGTAATAPDDGVCSSWWRHPRISLGSIIQAKRDRSPLSHQSFWRMLCRPPSPFFFPRTVFRPQATRWFSRRALSAAGSPPSPSLTSPCSNEMDRGVHRWLSLWLGSQVELPVVGRSVWAGRFFARDQRALLHVIWFQFMCGLCV